METAGKHTDNTISKIRELAATMDDHEIADQTKSGWLDYSRRKSIHICRSPLDPL